MCVCVCPVIGNLSRVYSLPSHLMLAGDQQDTAEIQSQSADGWIDSPNSIQATPKESKYFYNCLVW